MTNKELHSILAQSFPDLASGYWEEYPGTKYSNAYIIEVFTHLILELGRPKYNLTSVLTIRQVYLSTVVYELCTQNNLGEAIHQFIDCIESFSNTCNTTNELGTVEHLLYYGMAHAILLAAKHGDRNE